MKLACKVILYMQGYSHGVWIGERNLITHLVNEFLNSIFAVTDIKVLHMNRFFVISQRYWIIELTNICSILSWLFFYRITDYDNIKRRLYLSTVHKELSVTPLHAKIPLFMIKRKIVGTLGVLPTLRLEIWNILYILWNFWNYCLFRTQLLLIENTCVCPLYQMAAEPLSADSFLAFFLY